MNKLIFMLGISGSGKSHQAKEIAKKEKAVIVSTDAIRKELFGDESRQKNTNHVFYEVYSRIEKALAEGRSVILDATNLDREKRIKALQKFPDVEKECYYFDVPY